jgi:protein involved in polysaccharide export with SLBB domain
MSIPRGAFLGAAVIGAIAALGACASRVTVPPLRADEVPQIRTATNFPHGEYRLEPGDTVRIRYTFHSENDQDEIVRPDGKIRVTDVGEVQAAGVTIDELAKQLKEVTSKRLRDPEVIVSVTEFAPKTVYVAGEVGKPGPIPYRKDLSPLQAVIEAGGFRDTALTRQVVLVRGLGPDGRTVSRTLDMQRALRQGSPDAVSLAPRDVLYVPRTGVAEANIWVDQHFTQLFPFFRGASGKMDVTNTGR